MHTPKIILTLTCQICEKEGLIPMMPAKGRGRRVVLHSNEWVSHVVQNGQHYLVRTASQELPELILN